NPMLIEGQLAGGFAQGVGGALLEEFLYDERGEPLSVNFADYLMPTAREVPPLDVLITQDAPSPLNPLGLKGAGEGGVNAVGAGGRRGIGRARRDPGRNPPPAGDAATAARYSRARRPLIAPGAQVIPTAAGVAPRRPWRARPCDRATGVVLSREHR